MTPEERNKHTIINASRRRRIAEGSGTTVADVNALLKNYAQVEKMMRQMKKMSKKPGRGLPFPL
jgi:signal recognition particle subunit SRP54